MAPSVLLLLAVTAVTPPAGEVVLPLDEYNRLIGESQAHAPPPSDPPVPSSVRQAAYVVTAQGRTARVKMTATVDVLAAAGVVQPLMANAAALMTLKVDGQPAGARLYNEYYAVPLSMGVHTVEMEVVVPVESEGPSELSLPIPPSLSARLTAELPGNKLNVQIDGVTDINVQRGTSQTLVTAALPVTETLSMSWVRQGSEEDLEEDAEEDVSTPPDSATPGKARALVLHHVAVDETVLRGTVRASLTVQKGTRSQVALTLPKNVEVLDVQATDLREWNATVEGDLKKVLVSFKYGRTGDVPVTVRYERALGDKRPIDLPEPIVLDVESERGFVGIETAPGVEVALQQIEGAERWQGRDLPSDLWSMSSTPLVLGVKYLEHPLHVSLAVSPRTKVKVTDTTLDRADYETVINAAGRAVSALTYSVRNHQRQNLEVKLPEKTKLLSCFVGGRPVQPSRGTGKTEDTLYIPLNRSTAAEGAGAAFPVELVIAQDVGRLWPVTSLGLTMPSTDVQAMDLSWRVYVPVTHAAVGFGGNFSTASEPARTDRWMSLLEPAVDDALAGGGGEYSQKAASLEGYDHSQSVKARFQPRKEDITVASAVRVSRPLVGRRYDFRANLLRSQSPHVTLTVLDRDALTGSGWLAVLLALAGALLWAERKRGTTGISAALPVPLMVAGLMVGLISGLYVDHVLTRVLLALLAAPASAVAIHLVATRNLGLRKLGWPIAVIALGFLAIAVFNALVGQTVAGASVFLVLAYGLARLLRRFFLRPPAASTAAPPSGTPVTGASTPSGGAA